MTTVEFMQFLGKEAYIRVDGGIEVIVKITDIKSSYGKIRYNVEPKAGRGSMWVEQISLL
jgi:hypothetical protein